MTRVEAATRTASVGPTGARLAYDVYAPVYDIFTAAFEYDVWLPRLLKVLAQNGLSGDRLLDVGCGTGKSFLPLLDWGWTVTGCDISTEMLNVAREKVDASVPLFAADMRELPRFGEFDLVWALDDAVNYLLCVEELERALVGMRDNLAPSGLLLFDVNELLVFHTFFAQTVVVERDGRRLVWKGKATADVAPGSVCEAHLEIGSPAETGGPVEARDVSVHRQRHFSEAEVLTALRRAGLDCLNVYGHGTDGVPRQPMDPSAHTKAIYVARRRQR